MWKMGIQITLPVNYLTDKSWSEQLSFIRDSGIDHIELNVLNPENTDAKHLTGFIEKFDLKIRKIATGGTAKAEGLSLSSGNETIRIKTIQRCRQFVEFASEIGADIILGSIKGLENIPKQQADANLAGSLNKISEYLTKTDVKVYLEAINRYETTAVNTVSEGFKCIHSLNFHKNFSVLPDTYHINIEEENYFIPFVKYSGLIDTVHLSDSNRYFPGFGSFDFLTFFKFLKAINYEGTLTLEANIKESLVQDLKKSMAFLNGLFNNI